MINPISIEMRHLYIDTNFFESILNENICVEDKALHKSSIGTVLKTIVFNIIGSKNFYQICLAYTYLNLYSKNLNIYQVNIYIYIYKYF